MAQSDQAYINPQVLRWAIERSGLPHRAIEEATKIPEGQLEEFELGELRPSFAIAQNLAKKLQIPFGYLYLPEPPVLKTPLPDFRSKKTASVDKPSSELIDAVFNAMNQQEWYREYAVENRMAKLSFVGKFSARNSVTDVAADIRSTIGIANGARQDASSWSDYLRRLVKKAEENRILVFRSGIVGSSTRRTLSVDEFQGFAISDEYAPVVFINATDFETSKIFTLVHELAHIWVGRSGISYANEAQLPEDVPAVEAFCNSVAAESLVPEAEFRQSWRYQGDFRSIENLARYFFVSTFVILRRARELELISVGEFVRLLEVARAKIKPKSKGSGGNFYATLESRNSTRLVNALVEETRRGATTFREAASLLSMKVDTFARFVEGQGS